MARLTLPLLLLGIALGPILTGCGSDAGKATAEDKRAIEDLTKTGLKPPAPVGGTPPASGGGGTPASGAVAPP